MIITAIKVVVVPDDIPDNGNITEMNNAAGQRQYCANTRAPADAEAPGCQITNTSVNKKRLPANNILYSDICVSIYVSTGGARCFLAPFVNIFPHALVVA